MSYNQELMLKRGFLFIFTCIALGLLVASIFFYSGYGRAYQASMWSLAATVMGCGLAINTRVPTRKPNYFVGGAGLVITFCAFFTMFAFMIGTSNPDADWTAMSIGVGVTFVGFLVSSLWTMLLFFPILRENIEELDENDPMRGNENYMLPNELNHPDHAMNNLARVKMGSAASSVWVLSAMSLFALVLWWFFALLCLMFTYDVSSSVSALNNYIPPDGNRVPPPFTKWNVNFTAGGPKAPDTLQPTALPTSWSPTAYTSSPTTSTPTMVGATLNPTMEPTTLAPTTQAPTTQAPSSKPSRSPTTSTPTYSPTKTGQPTSLRPSRAPSKATAAPIATPTSLAPTTTAPSAAPVTTAPPTLAEICEPDHICLGPYHVVCKGSGKPTVMFEAGLGETVWDYMWLVDYIGVELNITTACAYSRAGYGYSHKENDKNYLPRLATKMADELFAILIQQNLAPIVYVAHGYSSFTVKAFYKKYYDIVSGLAYLDAFNPTCYSKEHEVCSTNIHAVSDTSVVDNFRGLCPTGWPRARQMLPGFNDPMGATPYVQYLPKDVQQARYNSLVIAEFWETYGDELQVMPQSCGEGLHLGLGKADCVDVHILVVVAGNGSFASSSDMSCSTAFLSETQVTNRAVLTVVPDETYFGLVWKNESARIVGKELTMMVQRIRSDTPSLVRANHDPSNEKKSPCHASSPPS